MKTWGKERKIHNSELTGLKPHRKITIRNCNDSPLLSGSPHITHNIYDIIQNKGVVLTQGGCNKNQGGCNKNRQADKSTLIENRPARKDNTWLEQ